MAATIKVLLGDSMVEWALRTPKAGYNMAALFYGFMVVAISYDDTYDYQLRTYHMVDLLGRPFKDGVTYTAQFTIDGDNVSVKYIEQL